MDAGRGVYPIEKYAREPPGCTISHNKNAPSARGSRRERDLTPTLTRLIFVPNTSTSVSGGSPRFFSAGWKKLLHFLGDRRELAPFTTKGSAPRQRKEKPPETSGVDGVEASFRVRGGRLKDKKGTHVEVPAKSFYFFFAAFGAHRKPARHGPLPHSVFFISRAPEGATEREGAERT